MIRNGAVCRMGMSSANRCHCSRESSTDFSGEHRLPACRSRQLAETLLEIHAKSDPLLVAGRLPATAGWQPALPRSANCTIHDEGAQSPNARMEFSIN